MSHRLNVTLNLALSICYNANCNAQTEQGSRAGLAERLHTHTENETHQSLFPILTETNPVYIHKTNLCSRDEWVEIS